MMEQPACKLQPAVFDPDELMRQRDLHNTVFPFQKSVFEYVHQPGDIFIISYPKCGSNWVQHMLWSLVHDGEALPMGMHIHKALPWLEHVGKEAVENTKPPRFMKTHMEMNLLHTNPQAKYVYLTRNPKDVVVSYWHHFLGAGRETEDSLPSFVDRFLEGTLRWGCYYDHHLSSITYIGQPNFLIIKYEDLKKDTPGTLRKMLDFLDLPIGKISDELIAKMLENTSLKYMQKNPERFYLKWTRNDFGFIRQGKSRGWAQHLTAEQSARMDEKFVKTFEGTIVADWWKEEMKWPESEK